MTIVYVVGARPNFVKTAPVVAALRARLPNARHVVVHTGQHYDRLMSDSFIEQLQMPAVDYSLAVGSGTHSAQTARIMERLEPVLEHERPDLVIVPGDVNSTLAAALVAAKLQVPYGHVESGLRSFDRSMPEEINRIVADEFATHLFAHSEEAVVNLRREGIEDERIHLVGNTMIDSLVAVEPLIREANVAARFGCERGGYLLVTLHRPSLVDTPLLEEVLGRLDRLARDLPVLLPVHPRTKKRIGTMSTGRVNVVDPAPYLDFLSLQADAAGVLTDSGGVQEETTHLGVPCFTLRASTERPVTVRCGTNTVLGLNPARIDDILPALERPRADAARPPLWDGAAAERIADVLAPG